MRYLPRLYLDIHVRGLSLGEGSLGLRDSGLNLCCWPCGTESGRDLTQLSPVPLATDFSHKPPPHCPLPELLCAGQAAGLCGLAPVLESGPGGFLEGQSAEAVHHHELVLQEGKWMPLKIHFLLAIKELFKEEGWEETGTRKRSRDVSQMLSVHKALSQPWLLVDGVQDKALCLHELHTDAGVIPQDQTPATRIDSARSQVRQVRGDSAGGGSGVL